MTNEETVRILLRDNLRLLKIIADKPEAFASLTDDEVSAIFAITTRAAALYRESRPKLARAA